MPRLEVRTAHIDITGIGPEPDQAWKFIDTNGHAHHYDKGYPTLREITEPVSEDGEEWEAHVRWECPHCDEVIEPSKRYNGFTQTIFGQRSYIIDGRHVPRDEFLPVWRSVELQRLAEREAQL